MHSFKKAIAVTLAFVLAVMVLSVCVIEFYYQGQPYQYQDTDVRASMQGTIDYVFCGASHAIRGIDPQIVDEELGTVSYNLSYSQLTMQGRYTMLKKELERNPVKTVVLELSYNSMTRDRQTEGPEGDIYLLGVLDSPMERLRYFRAAMPKRDYVPAYAFLLSRGATSAFWVLRGRKEKSEPPTKGFQPSEPTDLSWSPEKYRESFNQASLISDFTEDNLYYLQEIIKLCKANDVRIVMITVPVSKQYICSYDNFDVSRGLYEATASEANAEFYDFNLLKDKDTLFPEENAFSDDIHLSRIGAQTFTELYCDVMKRVEQGEDISPLFYSTYAEMEQHEDYSK